MDSVAEVGTKAPDFELTDLDGKPHPLADADDVVVLDFWSANCPWSEQSDERLQSLMAEQDWTDRVEVWRIASNVNEGPADLSEAAHDRGVSPVLLDHAHEVADLYGAQTTPHFFVIDADQVLRYAGAPDDSTWRNPEPTRSYLRSAVEAALRGETSDPAKTPGRGCTIVRHQPSSSTGGRSG